MAFETELEVASNIGSSSTMSTGGSGTWSVRLMCASLRVGGCRSSLRYPNSVKPLEGVGQVTAVVAVVMATGRKGQKRHIGIAAGGCQHLSIRRPGLFVLSTADQQQLSPVKAVVAV